MKYYKVKEKDRGLTKQRNFGVARVQESCNVVCFLDDDTVLEPTYFEEIIKTYTIHIDALGVGGYRHRLYVKYNKKFKNGKGISIEPLMDYGFSNQDLKGELTLAYLYNPNRASRIQVKGGDIYDFINSYQSIVGTWGPGNRVRNQKLELTHRMEILNGLYLENSFLYSNRSSIAGINYPTWVDGFGTFAKPTPFEGYKISLLTTEFEYHHHQKYLIKNKRKVVIGSKWPTVAAKFNVGVPSLFGGQSNFGFLEFRIADERKLRTFGDFFFKLTFGQFLYKNDLRVIEHKYFRTSDNFFFSNPTNSMQSLDTNMNTSVGYFGKARATKDATPQLAAEDRLRFGVSKEIFHRKIKPKILDKLTLEEKKKLFGATNPDIGVNNLGSIVLRDRRTKKTINTSLSLDSILDTYKK